MRANASNRRQAVPAWPPGQTEQARAAWQDHRDMPLAAFSSSVDRTELFFLLKLGALVRLVQQSAGLQEQQG
jgi:hypothetical protein